MSSFRLRRSTLLTAALLLAASARGVTLQGPADVAALTAAADAVVRGQVLRTTSAWAGGDPKSGLIYTFVDVRPLEWWKGEASASVRVRVPGGAVGELGQVAQGAATFAEGEEVVVFLHKRGEVFDVERWALGKFVVHGSASGKARAVRSREGVACDACRPGEPDELSVDDLRARVLAARGGVGK